MRRDQVEAQSYLTSRLASALVRADPDAIESPNRRDSRALIASVLAGAVAVAVVVVVNLLLPQHSLAWRNPGQLIVDKGTGSRYLLVDGQLRPVQNLASARLLVGKDLSIASVSSSTLKTVPRGAPIGVSGEPDSLPQATLLNQNTWQICAVDPSDAGKTGAHTVIRIGAPAAGRLSTSGLLVTVGGDESVIYRGHRYELAGAWVADVLGFGTVPPASVSANWLQLFPSAGSLAPITITAPGKKGPIVNGKPGLIGSLYTVSGSQGHYILLADGLAPLTPLQYLLQTASTKTSKVTALSPYAMAHATKSPRTLAGPNNWPETTPALHGTVANKLPCLQYAVTNKPNRYDVVYVDPPAGAHLIPGSSPATAVAVTPGGGALVAAIAPTAQRFTDVAMVSDAGEVFPVPTSDALQALGYSLEQVAVLPDSLRDLLPQGVPLAKQS